MNKPQVTKMGIFDMQVCVPKEYTDEKVVAFAESEQKCGTTNGWCIRKAGNKRLAGHPERVQCAERENFIHIMLEA